MATIDWPTSPAVGDLLIFGARTWSWNGTGWARVLNQAQTVSVFQVVGPYVYTNAALPIPAFVAPNFTLLNYV